MKEVRQDGKEKAEPAKRLRTGAVISLVLWMGVVMSGRAIAYDWFDCHKYLSYAMYCMAGCADEMALLE